mmetsp:Transcript_74653/g.155661  ORF Transcript_74653/g.155661 Transcript_74653/m.155661 type:complete len:310 (+) Transcript_74653:114-1043(+)
MPRGGHFGLWKPTPQDIYKSRWKRFYKYAGRTGRNQYNNYPIPPGYKGRGVAQDVQDFYKLNIGGRFDLKVDLPLKEAERQFMRPALECKNPCALPAILRSLEGRVHGGAETGIGRANLAWFKPAAASSSSSSSSPSSSKQADDNNIGELKTFLPFHMQNRLRTLLGSSATQESEFYKKVLEGQPEHFHNRKIQALVHEHSVVWHSGGSGKAPGNQATTSRAKAGAGGAQAGEKNRGNFPYIEEQASLLTELNLRAMLRVAHRTNLRRHPKWREIEYEFKKGHRNYLRRRDVMLKEQKASMGIITGLTQ